jgi:hypothetical protein
MVVIRNAISALTARTPLHMTALERAYPGATITIAAEAGLENEMFTSVAGLQLPLSAAEAAGNVVQFPVDPKALVWRRTNALVSLVTTY